MSWASKRRTTYTSIVIAAILLIGGVFFFFVIYDTPSCFDGVQNGKELDIDCGGGCKALCSQQTQDPIVLWSRVFEVVPGVYNAVAYINNPNSQAHIKSIAYTFKVFDAQNILIAERQGRTFISRIGIEPIFEPSIQAGNRIPARTFFEFLEIPQWERKDKEFPNLSILNRELISVNGSPRVTATVKNNDVKDVFDIEVIATVFNQAGNAFASSRTFIETLEGRTSVDVVFTWPTPFLSTTAKIDIIPRVSLE